MFSLCTDLLTEQFTSSETSIHLNNKAHSTPSQLTHYTQLLLLKRNQLLEEKLGKKEEVISL